MHLARYQTMFDLVTAEAPRALAHQDPRVIVVSSILHGAIFTLLVAVPLVFVNNAPDLAPAIMAFVAEGPRPAPPPPPPPPPAAAAAAAAQTPAHAAGPLAAPVEAPQEIRPEIASAGADGGVPGGVEGGIPGGVIGGVVGGLAPPSPPPPPAPPAVRAPVRVGGSVQSPALLYRVDPVYPPTALAAKISGVVVLEAIVDEGGRVKSVKALRSHPLLERAAMEAVQQWRYSPLVLNGEPQIFVLTVTLTFTAR
jgi:periplasmic protein TonB